eukprot:TRINITY_DN14114_c0_g1_i2.p1 TRINITY_DN14114_c0_g1~~TRINITY_DN14114_c0_g1_i2.p1  ORF type:complete len:219 (-),score=35.95 TRINITY_DN14114_c0_g1_i2:146-802(-)
MDDKPVILPLPSRLYDKAIDLCVRSFGDDSIYTNVLYKDLPDRTVVLKPSYRAYLEHTKPHGLQFYIHPTGNEDEISCLMVAMPPNIHWPSEEWNKWLERHKQILEEQGKPELQERYDITEDFWDDCRESLFLEDCFYLVLLATSEDQRGKGLASLLLQHLFDMADKINVGIYIECTEERNLEFYLKRGFKVMQKLPYPVANDEFCSFMKRDPVALKT